MVVLGKSFIKAPWWAPKYSYQKWIKRVPRWRRDKFSVEQAL